MDNESVSMFDKVLAMQQSNEAFFKVVMHSGMPFIGGFYAKTSQNPIIKWLSGLGETSCQSGIITATVVDVVGSIFWFDLGYSFTDFIWTTIGFAISWFLFVR